MVVGVEPLSDPGVDLASSRLSSSAVLARRAMSSAATSSPGTCVCCPAALWARVASAAALRML